MIPSSFLFKFIRHNIIHWGGNCGKNAQIPRISLAATFKAKKSTSTHLTSNGLLNNVFDSMKASPSPSPSSSFFNKHNGSGGEDKSESEMSTSNRVKLIASSLLMYSDWFDLEGSALPDDFYRLVGHPRPVKHKHFDNDNDCEFDEPPPPSSSIETLYPTDVVGDAAPPVVAVAVVENIITEEEFAEYTPSTEIVDV